MKRILGVLILVLVGIAVSAGPIRLWVYGKGGIIQKGDGSIVVCPNSSEELCTQVLIEGFSGGSSLTNIEGTMLYQGKTHRVEILEAVNFECIQNKYRCNSIVVRSETLTE